MIEISTASEVIARRDALSPSADNALKVIQGKLIDSEWVRMHSPSYVIFFDYGFAFTKSDVAYVEKTMREAGYINVSLGKCGDESGSWFLNFSLPEND